MFNSLKRYFQVYLGFSKSEAKGLLLLIALVFLVLLVQVFSPLIISKISFEDEEIRRKDEKMLEEFSLEIEKSFKSGGGNYGVAMNAENSLHTFDPNTATFDDMKSAGVPSALANRIMNYRNKGGKFYCKKDLLKIYGFSNSLYEQIASRISLPEDQQRLGHQSFEGKKSNSFREVTARPVTIKEKSPVSAMQLNLNETDTVQLNKLKGIGPVLAKRICTYRKKLGGFIDKEQIKEIYGLSEEVVGGLMEKTFIATDFIPEKININELAEKDGKIHPYLSPYMVKAIVRYRNQHGNFSSIEEILKIKIIDETTFQKVKPYLTY